MLIRLFMYCSLGVVIYLNIIKTNVILYEDCIPFCLWLYVDLSSYVMSNKWLFLCYLTCSWYYKSPNTWYNIHFMDINSKTSDMFTLKQIFFLKKGYWNVFSSSVTRNGVSVLHVWLKGLTGYLSPKFIWKYFIEENYNDECRYILKSHELSWF